MSRKNSLLETPSLSIESMAVSGVVFFFALVFASLQVKTTAFCSSDSFNLYLNNTFDNLVIKENFHLLVNMDQQTVEAFTS